MTKRGYVLVSVGGDPQGYEVIAPCIKAWKNLVWGKMVGEREMVIFTGPFMPDEDYQRLQDLCVGGQFRLSRFTSDFLHLLN